MPNAPTAPWGRRRFARQRPDGMRRATCGVIRLAIRSAPDGLGLSGIGEGGGGRGEGIGLGSIGTIGHGAGTGTGQGFGGGSRPPRRFALERRAPQVRDGRHDRPTAGCRPEVMPAHRSADYGRRFRLCYENGLRNNPNLQGRVSVRFVIGARRRSLPREANGGVRYAGCRASSGASFGPTTGFRSRSHEAAAS